jgi:hypothetical protein
VTEQPATVEESKAPSAEDADDYLELYRRMRLIRRF